MTLSPGSRRGGWRAGGVGSVTGGQVCPDTRVPLFDRSPCRPLPTAASCLLFKQTLLPPSLPPFFPCGEGRRGEGAAFPLAAEHVL